MQASTVINPIDIPRMIKVSICIASITIVGVPQIREPLRKLIAAHAPQAQQQERNKILEFFAPSLEQPAAVGDKVAGFIVSSAFGDRSDPITGETRFHGGVDVATPIGTPLFPIAEPGETVTVACANDPGGYGLFATYKTTDGEEVLLGHLDQCSPGTYQAGTPITKAGNTGRSTGAHLHFEIRTPQGERRSATTLELWQTLRGEKPRPIFSR